MFFGQDIQKRYMVYLDQVLEISILPAPDSSSVWKIRGKFSVSKATQNKTHSRAKFHYLM